MKRVEDAILTKDGQLILSSALTHEIAQWADKLKVYKIGVKESLKPKSIMELQFT